MSTSDHFEILLDMSRLIWRAWRGTLPTGIDRVCLEYLAHFRSRSLAVVQYKGRTFVLSRKDSDRLSSILLRPGGRSRRALAVAAPLAWLRSRRIPPRAKMLYLNVGHTGLHDPALGAWIADNHVRAVHLIHDLIPITHPQFCRAGEADKHRLRMQIALRSACGLIANSQATLKELASFAMERSIAMPRARAIWIGANHPAHEVQPRRLELPHFVTVGTIEGRKNHALILRIWRRLIGEMGKDAPMLFVVGQRGWQADEALALLDDPGNKARIVELRNCGDRELADLTSGARALLMPSFAEGFGLPVLEALQLRTPVIAADLPVYRELVGNIPTYIPAADEERWEAAVRQFLDDSPERERQKRALESYSAPEWADHFAKVEEWLAGL